MQKVIVKLFIVCAMIATFSACGKNEEQVGTTVQSGSVQDEYSFETEAETEETTGGEAVLVTEDEATLETEGTSEVEADTEAVTPPLYGAELDSAELMEDMQAIFQSALDFVVPEEQLDAAGMVSNAILTKTEIVINHAEDGICNITVKYPNAAEALKAADAQLGADASQEQIDEMLKTLAQSIENGEVDIVEKTLDVSIIEVEEFKTIEWTTELYDAITGGLYSIG